MKRIIVILMLSASTSNVLAFDLSPVNPLSVNRPITSNEVVIPSFDLKRATLSKNSIKNQYTIAMNKFMQSNIRSSYFDFKNLIDNVTPSDYVYIKLAQEMASVGFFSLADLAMTKINDTEIAATLEKDIKNFYFPSFRLNSKDQLYLAEIYSNIMYNDQSKEATAELIKNTSLLIDSDYANYVAALGYMKSGDAVNAKKYIAVAIDKNPQNYNYKILKSEILAQSENQKASLNCLKSISADSLGSVIFDEDLHSAQEYILYKTSKNEYLKKYHLAHYYFDKGEFNKALGVLQTSISGKKNINKDVYALTSKVYYDLKEYEKARDYALKSLDIDKSDFEALIVIGDTYYRDKDYNTALKFYKKAYSNDKNYAAAIKLAKTYSKLNDIVKAKEIYSKILKTSSKTYEAYYQMALLEKDREEVYLKKALSINPNFTDAWIDLARIAISKDNYDAANVLLSIVKYIDDNNYRYYYYLGLVLKNKGLITDANKNFRKSLEIYPEYDLAKEELSI